MIVQFLQGHHRDEDVVFLEAEKATGIVHQHVGVEDENLAGWILLGCVLARHREFFR
jgi:hypothetical protein